VKPACAHGNREHGGPANGRDTASIVRPNGPAREGARGQSRERSAILPMQFPGIIAQCFAHLLVAQTKGALNIGRPKALSCMKPRLTLPVLMASSTAFIRAGVLP